MVNQKFDRIVVTLRTTYGLEKHVANVLVYNYGTRALQVKSKTPIVFPHRNWL